MVSLLQYSNHFFLSVCRIMSARGASLAADGADEAAIVSCSPVPATFMNTPVIPLLCKERSIAVCHVISLCDAT
jgi:hypothetical protein